MDSNFIFSPIIPLLLKVKVKVKLLSCVHSLRPHGL